ncbi:MgtE intracellular region [Fictibacillus macauensis ZFHKF-1]|uniref:MgtE intracellular region n=1 Tax=Fictibacillus macauensis ZFHKF-1 TaxID=1196324 RepID=I8UDV0_9BACL|nr:MgtE intracellular region [Fictibacillus macauensis]EIT85085.1 MgtE intracellular region [Fictibacillus macauensis ZFHKF-1]
MEKKGVARRFLLSIVFSLLFLCLSLGLILSFLGWNVWEDVKKNVPLFSSSVTAQDDHDETKDNEAYWKKKDAEREKTVSQLKQAMTSKDEELQKMKTQLKQLQSEKKKETKKVIKEPHVNTTQLASWYETMSPKKAAVIFEKMKLKEVKQVLHTLDDDVSSAILEKMSPTQAAKLTAMMNKK